MNGWEHDSKDQINQFGINKSIFCNLWFSEFEMLAPTSTFQLLAPTSTFQLLAPTSTFLTETIVPFNS